MATVGRRGSRDAAHAVVTCEARLVTIGRRTVRAQTQRVDGIAARLRALDPRRVLERGYSITRDDHGRVVRTAVGMAAGAVLVTETADGALRSRVEDP